VRFGVGLPVEVVGLQGTTLIEWMRRIDDGPFSTIAVVDEIVSHNYEGLTTLAAAAAVTRRARLMSVVVAGPTRNTAILAKQAATIDAISGGRLSLGLGVGELEDDFAVTGTDMRGRGKRFDRQLEMLRRIWAGEPMGERDRAVGPTPAQPGGPEILLGGWAEPAMRRIGRFADGYVGAIMSEEMITDGPYQIALESWREHQRPGSPRFVQNVYFALGPDAESLIDNHLSITYAGTPDYDLQAIRNVIIRTDDDVRRMIERLDATGVEEIVFHPFSSDLTQLDRLEQSLP
jgi:alkanesulfonate monooxygenase SsuD/methylene tetrahydromethanopterin reductase-like flavin-dependent oxidoreductase (luciferase family)